MALPILDGNQTSTTLATTFSGGAHYPNHIIASGTVTALLGGSSYQQINDGIASYIGDNGTLPISGTVTANCRSDIYDGINDVYYNKSIIAWGNPFLGEPSFVEQSAPLPISGTVTANLGAFGLLNTQGGIASDDGGVEPYYGVQLGYYDGDYKTVKPSQPLPISGSVSVANSVTISALPVSLSTTTIGGTARLNVTLSSSTTIGATAPSYGNLYGGSDGTNLRAILVDSSGRTTVTGSVSVLGTPSVTMGAISGTVTANVASTTVTISAQPSGALTTRFGSVTTANTAQITTAVTNTSRKYLLAQNISTGTVTIGIGFSPTTTQGIQLTAGAGLTFDSFVPTGAVWWLGATTGATWTILEG